MRSTSTAGAAIVLALAAAAVSGCGGGTRQDAGEPTGTYAVEVVDASFPARQRLAQPTELRIRVRNADRKTLPTLAVTITSEGDKEQAGGFAAAGEQTGALADPRKAVWIVDRGPRGADTAYVGTWSTGPLPPGRSRSFVWRVTAVQPGRHTIRYRVAAGLNGNAVAQTVAGDEAAGTFKVDIAQRPATARVDAETGDVVRGGQ